MSQVLPPGWDMVRLRHDLHDIEEIPFPEGYCATALDPDDPAEIDRWLSVYNAAFDRTWTRANWQAGMVDNPYVEVLLTFLVEHRDQAVAAASIGRWRGEPAIGADHNLAVVPEHRGQGVATALVASRVRSLSDMGFERIEAQTHLHRVGSLVAHFRGGFRPVYGRSPWHSPDVVPAPVRTLVHGRLWMRHRRWRAGRTA